MDTLQIFIICAFVYASVESIASAIKNKKDK